MSVERLEIAFFHLVKNAIIKDGDNMKKTILFISVLLLCVACSQTQQNSQFTMYEEIKNDLKNQQNFDKDFPFRIQLIFNQLDQKYRYDIIIDQPQINMYNIMALAYAQETDEQSCPVIGLFDQEPYHLHKNYVNKAEHFYKGIQLSGECEMKRTVKVYISYYINEEKTEKKVKYIEVSPS